MLPRLRLPSIFAVPLLAVGLASTSARAQDAAAGEKLFVKCKSCHQVGETAKNNTGPELNGLFRAGLQLFSGHESRRLHLG